MPYLFDTDSISELLRKKPAPGYVQWVSGIPREDQYTSAIVVRELFRGAYRSPGGALRLKNVESRVLSAVTVLPYDVAVARVYGEVHAGLSRRGMPLADADLRIAATALHHGLQLVSETARHCERVPGLRIAPTLVETRQRPLR